MRRARLAGRDPLHDIAIAGERIAAIETAVDGDAANEIDAEGRLAHAPTVTLTGLRRWDC